MSKQTINIGASPNDGTGTPLRTAFDYCNLNFTELYTAVGPSGNNIVVPGTATITGDLTVASSILKVTGGNVGINTATPTNTAGYKTLEIVGTGVNTGGMIRMKSSDASVSSYDFIDNNGRGIFAVSNHNLRFGCNDIEQYRIQPLGIFTWYDGAGGTRMTLNSTGLAIGGSAFSISRLTLVSSASNDCLFSLQKSGTARTAVVKTDGTNLYLSSDSGATGNKISLSLTAPDSSLSIDSSGNVGIGVTPAAKLDVYQATLGTAYFRGGYSARQLTLTATSDGVNDGAVHTFLIGSSAGQYKFSNSSGTLMSLDASGNLLVGTTDTGSNSGIGIKSVYSSTAPYVATVGSSTSASSYSYLLYSTGGTPAYKFYVSYSGQISATSGTVAALSDARFKENVQDIDVGLGAILALKPRKFDWKAGKGKDIKGDRGFIAQEFEQVFPNLIEEWADPAPEGEAPYKSVRQDLIPVLVKAIQELTARVQTLEAK